MRPSLLGKDLRLRGYRDSDNPALGRDFHSESYGSKRDEKTRHKKMMSGEQLNKCHCR
jgi:hypothetical protein